MSWFLYTLIIVMMVLSACSNGGGSKNTGTTDGGAKNSDTDNAQKASVPLSIFMVGDTNQDYSKNSFTLEMDKMLNADIKIEINDGSVVKEKRQISLTSGDYADVFMLNWADNISPEEQVKLGKQGVLLPLNDLIDQYAPNIKKRMEEIPYYKQTVTAPDGNIYGLPSINECYHCSFGAKMWLNKDWLKTLKMDIPKTTEQFTAMLRAFKNTDLNGNGKKDEVPFSSLKGEFITPIMNAFTYFNNDDYLSVENGKVSLSIEKPEFKEGLKYLASLFKEGLIDPGALTYEWDPFRSLTNRDGMAMVGAVASMHPYNFVAQENPIYQQYTVLPPLTGPEGVSFAKYTGGQMPGAAFAITNKADKDQQIAAIKLADYLATDEGTTRATRGIEGVNWAVGGDKDIDLNGNKAQYTPLVTKPDDPKAQNNAWSEVGPFVKTKAYRDSWASNQDEMSQAGYELHLQNATKQYDGHQPKEIMPGSLFIDDADLMDYGLMKANINKYIEENMYKFITGNKDPDKDWDSYINGLKKLDTDRYLSIIQKSLDTMKK